MCAFLTDHRSAGQQRRDYSIPERGLSRDKELREQLGLKKTGKKLAEVWEAHCVDAWVLASSEVGGNKTPDKERLLPLPA